MIGTPFQIPSSSPVTNNSDSRYLDYLLKLSLESKLKLRFSADLLFCLNGSFITLPSVLNLSIYNWSQKLPWPPVRRPGKRKIKLFIWQQNSYQFIKIIDLLQFFIFSSLLIGNKIRILRGTLHLKSFKISTRFPQIATNLVIIN